MNSLVRAFALFEFLALEHSDRHQTTSSEENLGTTVTSLKERQAEEDDDATRQLDRQDMSMDVWLRGIQVSCR